MKILRKTTQYACIVSSIVDHLDMSSVNKLYNGMGRCPYHPRMMLKVIIYAYMNNIYSCRRIEQLLLRDIHFIWLAGYEKPDFITINRFRNRLKDEINNIFTQLVLVLAEKGFVSLDVEYVDGTKIESKANKYTFVWRKTVERNRARLIDKVKALLAQVDDCIATIPRQTKRWNSPRHNLPRYPQNLMPRCLTRKWKWTRKKRRRGAS